MNLTNKVAVLVATWFGCGYVPAAPGTAGSVGALIPAFLLVHYAHWQAWYFALLALAALAPAIWAAGAVARSTGRKDPQIVVVDEVAGQWIALAGAVSFSWMSWLGAFVLFRLFDMWKPFPVRQLEALPGGTGIVADDVMAGVYAALVLWTAGCFNLY
ncbi:MAG: phosphatidylglycerophosphatase A family protein [Bryobacteraceae bacterium]